MPYYFKKLIKIYASIYEIIKFIIIITLQTSGGMLVPYFIMMLSESINSKIKFSLLERSPSGTARSRGCGFLMLKESLSRSFPDLIPYDFTHHFSLTYVIRSHL
jgi:hypothetical protein